MTAPTAGYLYLIESESSNDDWITDHAGDPDDIDISLFTEGTDYCKIALPRGWRIHGYTGAQVSTLGGSVQYSQRSAKRSYIAGCNGILTSVANANLMDKFIMSDRHNSGDSTVYKDYYMIPYHGLNSSNLVDKFVDHTNTQRAYCKGIVIVWSRNWQDVENLWTSVNLKFASVWQ